MTLSIADARDLDRYFSLGHFEKSTMGPILERQSLYYVPESEWNKPDEELTARITAEAREEPKVEPNTEDLELIGRVSRKLSMVGPLYRKALEAYHGDRGAYCAVQMKTHGRIVALFEFTPAGKSLAARERKRGKARNARPSELIERAIGKHELESDESDRGGTIAEALVQALALKERAEAAYTQASEEVRAARREKRAQRLELIKGGKW